MDLTRGISPTLIAELSDTFHPVALVYLDWPTGVVRAHSNAADISWDGFTWTGVGAYAALKVEGEELDLVPSEALLMLAGSLDTLLGEMGVEARNRRGRIYWGCTTEAGGNVLVADPVLIFSGYVDSRRFELNRSGSKSASAISLALASGPSARSGATIAHTQADQSAKYPGDTAGRHTIYSEANRVNPPKW